MRDIQSKWSTTIVLRTSILLPKQYIYQIIFNSLHVKVWAHTDGRMVNEDKVERKMFRAKLR